jgi:hypothetical protein
MSPRERCMEDAEKSAAWCKVSCSLQYLQNAQARNHCDGQCQQKQGNEYQLCQYKR